MGMNTRLRTPLILFGVMGIFFASSVSAAGETPEDRLTPQERLAALQEKVQKGLAALHNQPKPKWLSYILGDASEAHVGSLVNVPNPKNGKREVGTVVFTEVRQVEERDIKTPSIEA